VVGCWRGYLSVWSKVQIVSIIMVQLMPLHPETSSSLKSII